MNELKKEATKRFFGVLWEDVIGYLRLYEFIKLKAKGVVGSPKKVKSVSAFWLSILGDRFAGPDSSGFQRLRDGDVVKLKDLFLTEWAPKLPGQIWSVEGVKDFAEGQAHVDQFVEFDDKVYAVLDPYGKRKVVSAGFGSVRINRGLGDKDKYMYMGGVDAKSWSCDHGIPILVSRPVYKKYQKYAQAGSPWIKDLEGVLHINEDIPFREMMPKAIGAALSPEAESTLRYRPHLPRCYLHIVSPLSIQLTYNDSHPKATAWTMFETTVQREPLRYTYTAFNPYHAESIEQAVEFIEWYVQEYGGTGCVTDFDGQVSRLEATIPIDADPMSSRKRAVKKLIRSCSKWITQTLENEF